MSRLRIASRLPIVPESTKSPASRDVRDATYASRPLVVVSVWETPSPKLVRVTAASISAVGRVRTSPEGARRISFRHSYMINWIATGGDVPQKSNAAAPGCSQEFSVSRSWSSLTLGILFDPRPSFLGLAVIESQSSFPQLSSYQVVSIYEVFDGIGELDTNSKPSNFTLAEVETQLPSSSDGHATPFHGPLVRWKEEGLVERVSYVDWFADFGLRHYIIT